MAKLKKEEEVAKTSEYDFILPLESHQLKNMWETYANGKEIINFKGVDGKFHPAEYVYYNEAKVMSYDKVTGEWSAHIPDGMSSEDYNYKAFKAKRHWKQFEEYARKREYALSQNNIRPIDEDGQPEVKLNDFWRG